MVCVRYHKLNCLEKTHKLCNLFLNGIWMVSQVFRLVLLLCDMGKVSYECYELFLFFLFCFVFFFFLMIFDVECSRMTVKLLKIWGLCYQMWWWISVWCNTVFIEFLGVIHLLKICICILVLYCITNVYWKHWNNFAICNIYHRNLWNVLWTQNWQCVPMSWTHSISCYLWWQALMRSSEDHFSVFPINIWYFSVYLLLKCGTCEGYSDSNIYFLQRKCDEISWKSVDAQSNVVHGKLSVLCSILYLCNLKGLLVTGLLFSHSTKWIVLFVTDHWSDCVVWNF